MRPILFVLLLSVTLSLPAYAGDPEPCNEVVVRDTSSVHATHDRQRPLTSSYLDTASTRLVDARRGFRSYRTVYRDGRFAVRRAYRSNRGLLHPDRPGRRYDPGEPRTSVTAFYGNARLADDDNDRHARSEPAEPMIVIIHDRRDADAQPERDAPARMEVTIYDGEPELPERSGAVIVRSDGTVISVGE